MDTLSIHDVEKLTVKDRHELDCRDTDNGIIPVQHIEIKRADGTKLEVHLFFDGERRENENQTKHKH